jgi:hypothetical protein
MFVCCVVIVGFFWHKEYFDVSARKVRSIRSNTKALVPLAKVQTNLKFHSFRKKKT